MSEETQTETAIQEAPVADVGPAQQAFADLNEKVSKEALRALTYGLDLSSCDSVEDLVEQFRNLNPSPELRALTRNVLESIASAYEEAKTSKELQKTTMPDLQAEWARAVALAAEDVSAQNAFREKQVRNVLAIVNNATTGRTEEQNALQLEVYNMNVQDLIDNEEVWASFVTMLETRQLNELQADIGYNLCVLPFEIGDPDKMGRAEIENTANLVKKLAELGKRLNIVFFLDVKPSRSEALEQDPLRAAKGSEQHEELTDILKNLSWDPKDGGRLGQKLGTLLQQSDASRYVVLNGGVGLLASRKMDEDLSEQDVQHAVLLSPSAINAGLVAWSVAGEGAPVIPTGNSAGTGAVVGVEAAGCVALREHQELSRRAGVNLIYIPERSSAPAVDTSSTLARADPAFNEDVGQCSVEAIMLSQYINRMAAQYVRRLKANQNTYNDRKELVVGPLKRDLEDLKAKGVLRDFDVVDNDMHDELAAQKNAIDIEISYVEVGKLDRATITVQRQAGGAEGNA
ncbi:MAG TPA: hypothetical protein RMG48_12245 [Myxococcales bacterium LLY-WYZ-16_1]|jgi:hypothetical protein|nr:hypothetical protein [Myxococcales bacterium LLY-WYZ-16_1]